MADQIKKTPHINPQLLVSAIHTNIFVILLIFRYFIFDSFLKMTAQGATVGYLTIKPVAVQRSSGLEWVAVHITVKQFNFDC
jgi:hypothetical protein